MKTKENNIRLWFDMWLAKTDFGIKNVFSDDAVYIESWGPKYVGNEKIAHWFKEWNARGDVVSWDIKKTIKDDDKIIVLWHFKCKMKNGKGQDLDGISVVKFNNEDQISFLQEFSCENETYDPYEKKE